jgi:hypothetical protein
VTKTELIEKTRSITAPNLDLLQTGAVTLKPQFVGPADLETACLFVEGKLEEANVR